VVVSDYQTRGSEAKLAYGTSFVRIFVYQILRPHSEARCPRAGTNLYLVAVSQVHWLLAHGLVGFSTPAFDLDRDAVIGGDPILCRGAMPFLTVTCMPF
jgi:hypothetical protein